MMQQVAAGMCTTQHHTTTHHTAIRGLQDQHNMPTLKLFIVDLSLCLRVNTAACESVLTQPTWYEWFITLMYGMYHGVYGPSHEQLGWGLGHIRPAVGK